MTKYVPAYIVVYLVKVFAIAVAFQKFLFIVKCCSVTSVFGAHSLSSISYRQKNIPLVFRAFEYLKRCIQINFHRQTDINDMLK